MGPWRAQNSRARQTALAAGSIVVGAVLMAGFRHFQDGGDALAGFLLGVLLLGIGVAGLLASARQTVLVDPTLRRIVVEDSTLFGTRTRQIAFGEVAAVSVGYAGKRSSFVNTYYLVLRLTSGQDYPLFAPGRFYPGASDRPTVEGWRRRLQEYLAP